MFTDVPASPQTALGADKPPYRKVATRKSLGGEYERSGRHYFHRSQFCFSTHAGRFASRELSGFRRPFTAAGMNLTDASAPTLGGDEHADVKD